MSKDKCQEGRECMEKANKFLKTSLLKWVPDYDSAADEFSKAAVCFRVGKSFKESKECLLKASQNYLQNGSLFHAAKSLEQAVTLSKEIGDLRDVPDLAMKASYYYQQHGSSGSASMLLSKAADMIQQTDLESSVKLLKEASNVASNEDSIGQAMEYTHKAARLLVKLQKYDEAEEELKRQIGYTFEGGSVSNMGRVAVELFLLQLAKDDIVAAKKVFNEYGSRYCEQAEICMLDDIINAYSDRDAEKINSTLNNSFIKYMDIEFAVLAKSLAEKWIIDSNLTSQTLEYVDDSEGTQKPQIDFGGGLC
ncbi:gamma-soluble NSF attachment protein-like [Daktulosphaira vitifoliae]|uniref:gamma-soluble NSF attachment protein-like n=1 Tax=Daktulosphaira vitifoliae TaxID=58002 RepID=UPI0021AAE11D|nr:gamma-soluble NSF attachment protein-like [Daktulosphaira vitifoliae]